MTNFLIIVIKLYKYSISPILGNRCRFLPTCSDYFTEALKVHGFFKGLTLGVTRILKCHPFKILGGSHGLDFVPKLKKSQLKFVKIKKDING